MTFAYFIAHSSLCLRADVSLRFNDAISFFSSSFVSIILFVSLPIVDGVNTERQVEFCPRPILICSVSNPSSEATSSAIFSCDCLLHQSPSLLPQLTLIWNTIF